MVCTWEGKESLESTGESVKVSLKGIPQSRPVKHTSQYSTPSVMGPSHTECQLMLHI